MTSNRRNRYIDVYTCYLRAYVYIYIYIYIHNMYIYVNTNHTILCRFCANNASVCILESVAVAEHAQVSTCYLASLTKLYIYI